MDVPDKFDQAVADAQREWPNLTFPPGAVTSRLVRMGPMLERRFVAVLGPFGLMSGDLDILGALRRAGGEYELSPAQMVRALMFPATTMTSRLDRLERLGYVERRPLPDDRRVTLVGLTATGHAVLDQAMPVYVEVMRRCLSSLNDTEQRTLASLLRRVLADLSSEGEE